MSERGQLGVRETCSLSLGRIAKELYLNGFVSQRIFSQQAHDLVQAITRWAIFMKKVARKKNEVYLSRLRRHRRGML
jgi:hypothetical protein